MRLSTRLASRKNVSSNGRETERIGQGAINQAIFLKDVVNEVKLSTRICLSIMKWNKLLLRWRLYLNPKQSRQIKMRSLQFPQRELHYMLCSFENWEKTLPSSQLKLLRWRDTACILTIYVSNPLLVSFLKRGWGRIIETIPSDMTLFTNFVGASTTRNHNEFLDNKK